MPAARRANSECIKNKRLHSQNIKTSLIFRTKPEATAGHARARCERRQAGVEQHVRRHHKRARPLLGDLPATGLHIYTPHGLEELVSRVEDLTSCEESDEDRGGQGTIFPPLVQCFATRPSI